MEEKRIAVLGVGIAGAISIITGNGHFNFFSTIVGIILLIALKTLIPNAPDTKWDKVLLSSVYALCWLITIAGFLETKFTLSPPDKIDIWTSLYESFWYFGAWAILFSVCILCFSLKKK